MEKSLFFWLCIALVAFLVVLLIFKAVLTDPDWRKSEVLRLEKILKDLISMIDTNPLAKQIVDEFDLLLFEFKAVDFLDEKQLEEYHHSLTEKVNSIFKCKRYSNDMDVMELLFRENSCRNCHGDCTSCTYLIAKRVDYYNSYIKGTEDMYERF
jgi:hypothetical protein